MYNQIKEYIRSNEGESLKPYYIENKLHIGIGHNLDDCGISRKVSEFIFEQDIEDVEDTLMNIFTGEWSLFPEKIQIVLIDMVFNMGKGSFLGFKKTISLLKKHNYKEAANELLKSVYATKLPNRALRNSELIKEASLIENNNLKQGLKLEYNSVIKKYIETFSQKHNLDFEKWHDDQEGLIAQFQNCAINFSDIKFDIDNGLDEDVLKEWLLLEWEDPKSLREFVEAYSKVE